MAFDGGTILAKLKLDKKGFSSGLKDSERAAKASSLRMGKIFAIGLGTALVGIGIRKFVDLSIEAAGIARTNNAFEIMAQKAGTSGASIIDDVRGITKALSNSQIRHAANNLEVIGVGMTKTARLTEIARSVSIATGDDLVTVLDRLSTGTASSNKTMLRSVGITFDAEAAHKLYAKSIDKTVKQLTEQDKRVAGVNEVMRQGQKIIEKVGAKSKTAADEVEHFGSAWANFKEDLGQSTVDAGVPGLLDKIAGGIDKVSEAIQRAKLNPGGFANRLNAFFGQIVPIPSGENLPMAARFGPRRTNRAAGGPSLQEQITALVDARIKAYALSQKSLSQNSPVNQMGQSGTNTGGGIVPFYDEVPKITQSMDGIVQQTDLARSAVLGLGDAFGSLGEAIASGGDASAAFGSALLGTLGGLSSKLGDMLIWAGTGLQAIQLLSGPMAIVAGLALKTLSGVFRGGVQSLFSGAGTGRIAGRAFNRADTQREGSISIIVQGDFNGDPVWIDRLISKIRTAQRDRGVEVVYAG